MSGRESESRWQRLSTCCLDSLLGINFEVLRSISNPWSRVFRSCGHFLLAQSWHNKAEVSVPNTHSKGACTNDVCQISGIFYPLPPPVRSSGHIFSHPLCNGDIISWLTPPSTLRSECCILLAKSNQGIILIKNISRMGQESSEAVNVGLTRMRCHSKPSAPMI